jgi:hypothetical protein
MTTNNLCQIYHVARCGSTLLTALVSNCANTYSEPSWTKLLFLANKCPEEIKEHFGSIVKLQSIATRIGFKPHGPKVFIYRPLDQYLQKMSEMSPEWINYRKELYGQYFSVIQGTELLIEPTDILQLHSIFWASCVIEMQNTTEVLWIKSNDFFQNKEETAKNVLKHFEKQGNPDMRFANINVKQLKLNGGLVRPFEQYTTESNEYVTNNHGLIRTETALENTKIFDTIEWAKLNIPVNQSLYY